MATIATAMGVTTAQLAMMGASAASSLIGVAGTIMSAKQQSDQAQYQAEVAKENARLAEESASAERQQGYEAMTEKRRQAAQLIGKQRAIAGASGAAVDFGSNLDVQEATASEAEIDSLRLMQSGYNSAYNYDLQATNYRNDAAGYKSAASSAMTSGIISATGQAFKGIADVGSAWQKYYDPKIKNSGPSISGTVRYPQKPQSVMTPLG